MRADQPVRTRRSPPGLLRVTVAAALLGKRVRYRASRYHKLPAIADWALRGFPVAPL